MSIEGTPCEQCAHLAQVFDNGRVMCQGIYRYIPKKVKTWTMREPCIWLSDPSGMRHANCSDYEKAKGQMTMEVSA